MASRSTERFVMRPADIVRLPTHLTPEDRAKAMRDFEKRLKEAR